MTTKTNLGPDSSTDQLVEGDKIRWRGRSVWLTVIDTKPGSIGAVEVTGPRGGPYTIWDMPDLPGPMFHITSSRGTNTVAKVDWIEVRDGN